MFRLDGRVALVTGGAQGIGAAVAEALADAGASVMIGDVDVDAGAQTAARLSTSVCRVAFRPHDVRDETQWADVIGACHEEFGGLDILVNNAGIALIKPLLETTLEEFRRVQEINVEGCFLGMKAAIPAIAERANRWPGGGAVINMSSIGGIVGSPRAIAYNASKGALRLMTKSAALECQLLDLKVRVNSLHPGPVDTALLADSMGGFGNVKRASSPSKMCRPGELAPAVVFLASDAASFMTGAELVVDGGFTAQ